MYVLSTRDDAILKVSFTRKNTMRLSKLRPQRMPVLLLVRMAESGNIPLFMHSTQQRVESVSSVGDDGLRRSVSV
jgi:hypothetical protein